MADKIRKWFGSICEEISLLRTDGRRAHEQMTAQIVNLDRQVEVQQVRVETMRKKAHETGKRGDRDGALHLLALANQAGARIKNLYKLSLQLHAMRDAHENAETILDVTQTMRLFTRTMRMPAAGEIEAILDEAREQMDGIDEASSMLAEPMGTGVCDLDSADLELELDAMLAADNNLDQLPAAYNAPIARIDREEKEDTAQTKTLVRA